MAVIKGNTTEKQKADLQKKIIDYNLKNEFKTNETKLIMLLADAFISNPKETIVSLGRLIK